MNNIFKLMSEYEIYLKDGNLKKTISSSKPTFIIAEIGSTHSASLTTAYKLIDLAYEAGADCVKFQKRDIQSLLTEKEQNRKYENKNSMANTYGKHREIMEFSKIEFKMLQKYAHEKGIMFSSSAFDKKSVDFLVEINVPFIKIPSCDLTNIPLLRYIAKKKKPVFMSTGMSDFEDIQKAYQIISEHEKRIVIFQCTSSYPTKFININLNFIKTIKQNFICVPGYSGHEQGILIPPIAVGLGARVIEKHLTYNKNASGSDHKTSLMGNELSEMIKNIRLTEKALGFRSKLINHCEIPAKKKLSKSITSTCFIKIGSKITENMITTKSPGTGIPASFYDDIISKKVFKNIEKNSTIYPEDLNMEDQFVQ